MPQEEKVIQKLSEFWVEIKYMSRAIVKIEKVFEQFSWLLEKQNLANKRILNLEEDKENCRERVRKVEDMQLKMITIATVVATVIWFILNKIF